MGKPIGEIPVRIRHQIINLFSGQLYQSPAKAIEELVANSYDAFAERCDAAKAFVFQRETVLELVSPGSFLDRDQT